MSAWTRSFQPGKILPAATPRMLAFVRIVVCAILLTSAIWEDLDSTALLPIGMRQPMGVLNLLYQIPGGWFAALCRNGHALLVLDSATCVVLFLALIGYRTRLTVAGGVLLYLLLGGIIRQYAWFYHTGLVPLYALMILAFTPCGLAWSVDRWLARRQGRALVPDDEPRPIDAWSIYATWIVVAMPYVMAGCSKLRAGPSWFSAINFKAMLLVDILQPMHFGFDFTGFVLALPNWVFVVMAIGAVAGEIAMGAVLLWPRTRQLIPLMMMAMHVVIWLLQRVLFFDLILIQLIFVVPPAWFSRRAISPAWSAETIRWPRPILALFAALAVVWVTRWESFPLTDMHMYTDVNTSGVIRYPQLIAHLASGRKITARPEKVIGAMSDARYRRLLRAVKKGDDGTGAEFFATCGRLMNRDVQANDPIIAFEVVWKSWDFGHDPDHPQLGKVSKIIRFDLVPSLEAEARATDAAPP